MESWRFLSATEGLSALRSSALDVEGWAELCLQRVAARDAAVRAWAWLDPHQVRDQARELDKSDVSRPLHGVPIGIKDIIHTADMPTQYNSPIYRHFRSGGDAACVAVLRAAGAMIFGKTETVEFASNARKAVSRNPFDPERTPGGSSSGSGAAVGDGQVPIALGTQTGGSVIRPASFCGAYAMKPTWGTVSRDGTKTYAPTLDTIGWYARDPRDLRLVYDVFDPFDLLDDAGAAAASAGGSEVWPLQKARSSSHIVALAGRRMAICRSPFEAQAAPESLRLLDTMTEGLRAAGAEVVELKLPAHFEQLAAVHFTIMRAEGRTSFLPEFRAKRHRLHDFITGHYSAEPAVHRTSLRQAWDLAARCRAEFDEIAGEFDAVVTPSSVGYAPRGREGTGDPVFNAMWTLLHVPCINLPGAAAWLELPLGVTITGPRGHDRQLLQLAEAFAAAGLSAAAPLRR